MPLNKSSKARYTQNVPNDYERSPINSALAPSDIDIADFDACLRVGQYLGQALKLARIERGIKQEELAQKLRNDLQETVSQSYVSKYETSQFNLSWDRFCLVCKHLRCWPSKVLQFAEFLAKNENLPQEIVLDRVMATTTQRLGNSKKKLAP